MQRSVVRPSVCLSHRSTAAVACGGGFAAGRSAGRPRQTSADGGQMFFICIYIYICVRVFCFTYRFYYFLYQCHFSDDFIIILCISSSSFCHFCLSECQSTILYKKCPQLILYIDFVLTAQSTSYGKLDQAQLNQVNSALHPSGVA